MAARASIRSELPDRSFRRRMQSHTKLRPIRTLRVVLRNRCCMNSTQSALVSAAKLRRRTRLKHASTCLSQLRHQDAALRRQIVSQSQFARVEIQNIVGLPSANGSVEVRERPSAQFPKLRDVYCLHVFLLGSRRKHPSAVAPGNPAERLAFPSHTAWKISASNSALPEGHERCRHHANSTSADTSDPWLSVAPNATGP